MRPRLGTQLASLADSILFKKRKTLFNFHRAKRYIQKHKFPFIVVEGYIDVIALYHVGLYGAVAPLGTALSDDQLIMMWKLLSILIYK